MQKMKSKFFTCVFATLLVVTFVAPFASFAEDDAQKNRGAIELKKGILERVKNAIQTRPTTTTPILPRPKIADDSGMKTGEFFCSRIPKLGAELEMKSSEREVTLLKKREEIRNNVKERKDKVEEKLSERRDEWSDNFDKRFAAIESRAKTDAEKNAARQFHASIELAISTRRSAIDAATAIFKSASDNSASVRKAKIDEITETYRMAVKSATEKAKADCAKNPRDIKSIREEYEASLKSAKKKFDTDRKAVETLKNNLNEEAKIYKQAIENANAEFKVKVQNALDELKKAFPKA